ncbi:MAG: adenine deaminase [Desulfovibrionales bacterium]|nr:adenine deaminase [Desulfovibrionales bacterium]
MTRSRPSLIAQARGLAPVDMLIQDCQVINVLSGEIHHAHVAVSDGVIIGFGDYAARTVVQARGHYLCPGLIEGHIHIESTMLDPVRFARTVAAHGTAVVVCDPHEIANVLGLSGIKWLLDVTTNLPVEIYCMMPSCVPATHLETAGAALDAGDIDHMLATYLRRILGLAEMMNYPGVLSEDPDVMAKLQAAAGYPRDGHAPGLSGHDLSAYILAGPASDHESCHLDEAREKLRKGMHLMIREGSSAKNLRDLVPLVQDYNSQNCSLVTDDRHCDDLVRHGHLDYTVRLAIRHGISPLRAIQMASINTARYVGLRRRGAIAPGFRADFMLLDDLEELSIAEVYLAGQPIDAHSWAAGPSAHTVTKSVHIAPDPPPSLTIPAHEGPVRVIQVVPGQIVTESVELLPTVEHGHIVADPRRDIAKLAVLERHHGSGHIGLGLVRGLGLQRGALASTVAHDSHNLIVAGVNDQDMLAAVQALVASGGGLVCVCAGQICAQLPLPVAGLMSDQEPAQVTLALDQLNAAARTLGCPESINPFMLLSFLALPVIPRLRLTDLGLVDVQDFCLVSLGA